MRICVLWPEEKSYFFRIQLYLYLCEFIENFFVRLTDGFYAKMTNLKNMHMCNFNEEEMKKKKKNFNIVRCQMSMLVAENVTSSNTHTCIDNNICELCSEVALPKRRRSHFEIEFFY